MQDDYIQRAHSEGTCSGIFKIKVRKEKNLGAFKPHQLFPA
jgi:hypothetical protein